MVVITEMGMRKEDIKYVGRASRTAERRRSLPPLDRRVAHQPARYLSQLSMIGWKADGGNLVADRGRPRYVCGKEEMCVPKVVAMDVARLLGMFIGTSVVFSKLMESPVAKAKLSRISFRFLAAVGVAQGKVCCPGAGVLVGRHGRQRVLAVVGHPPL
jgi:hypothetical protein